MDRRAKKSKQIFNINLKQSSRNVNNGLEQSNQFQTVDVNNN